MLQLTVMQCVHMQKTTTYLYQTLGCYFFLIFGQLGECGNHVWIVQCGHLEAGPEAPGS